MGNVLRMSKKHVIEGMIGLGWSDRRIQRETHVHRMTVAKYRKSLQNRPQLPPAFRTKKGKMIHKCPPVKDRSLTQAGLTPAPAGRPALIRSMTTPSLPGPTRRVCRRRFHLPATHFSYPAFRPSKLDFLGASPPSGSTRISLRTEGITEATIASNATSARSGRRRLLSSNGCRCFRDGKRKWISAKAQ